MDPINLMAWATIGFSWVGIFTVARWIGDKVGTLAWEIDAWSEERAYALCGQAILDYEFNRGVDGLAAWKYAHRMM